MNGKEETMRALQAMVNLAFGDQFSIYTLFDKACCIRSKYTHQEIIIDDLKECLKSFLRDKEKADDQKYLRILNSLSRTFLELLRLTILVCLVSQKLPTNSLKL